MYFIDIYVGYCIKNKQRAQKNGKNLKNAKGAPLWILKTEILQILLFSISNIYACFSVKSA